MTVVFHSPSAPLNREVEAVLAAAKTGGPLELWTSGTTGAPRRVVQNLAQSLARNRVGSSADRFLLTFSPARWAGVSVVIHCFQVGCTLIVPVSLTPADLIAAWLAHHPTHVSLTPSLFRNLVLHDAAGTLRSASLRQITFGGEAAPQSVLDLARAQWPLARITHTYASTEHGDICAVSDGLAGFPASKLAVHTFADGAREGELIIGGVSTGDFWRLVDGRFYFVGRKEEIINVGGNKVSPGVVEEAAFQCGVRLARAYRVDSPLLGSLVALDYVGDITPLALRRALAERLPKYACPARLNHLERLPLSDAGKLVRIS